MLVAKERDLAVDRVGERHAGAADELQAVMAEAHMLLDVARVDRARARNFVAIAREEAEQRRHEAARLRKLKARGGECRAWGLRIRDERGALDDVRGRRRRRSAARRDSMSSGNASATAPPICCASPAARARSAVTSSALRPAPVAMRRENTGLCSVSIAPTSIARSPSVIRMARPRRSSPTARSNVKAARSPLIEESASRLSLDHTNARITAR